MSYLGETSDIETLFTNEWTVEHPDVPIEYDNSDHDPGENETYVTLIVLPARASQIELGKPTNNYRHWGNIVVQVHTPRDLGSGRARELADTASGIFRSRHFGAGIIVQTPVVERVGEVEQYYQVNVVAPFWRDAIF